MSKRLFGSVLCALALGVSGAALAQSRAENAELVAAVDSQFNVLEANASVSFPSNLNRYQILDDDSLLLTFGANRHYRVKLNSDCGRELRNDFAIALLPSGAGHFDQFGAIEVRGIRCNVRTIDRVERVEQGA